LRRRLTVQVQKNFGKEPTVEQRVRLELYFDKHQGPVECFRRRDQNTVQAKSGLLDLFRPELVSGQIGSRPTSQFKHQFRQTLE